MTRIIHSLSDLVTGTAAANHVPLYHETDGWKTVLNPVFDVRAFGAAGDGATDDTEAIQAAVDAAGDVQGAVYFPPLATGASWRVTDTIVIEPTSSASFIQIDILGGGKGRNITWDGGSSKSVFRSRNWKYGSIQGIDVDIPASATDVVTWELKSDASYESNSNLTWRDCGVRFGNGAKGCVGWKAISDGGLGDFASMTWDGCVVVGGNSSTYATDGNVGWRSLAANALVWNWRSPIVNALAVGFSNQAQLTLLNGAITDSQTTITVDGAGYFPYAGKLTIGSERISYTSRNATQFLGCTRGVDSTVAASHIDNLSVTEYTTGATAGGSWTVVGANVDEVSTVFDINSGPFASYGGRSESIERLLRANYGGSSVSQRYLLSGHNVASATPRSGVLIALGNAAQLAVKSCDFRGTDYTAAMITATGTDGFGTGGATGSVSIDDSSIRGTVGTFWTLPATWQVDVRNAIRVNSSGTPQSRIDTARVFDVRRYGAVGDGTTDDTAAIQAAVDAAEAAGGGVVDVPNGTYLVSGLTVQGPGITLRGASRAATKLKTTSGDLIALNASAVKFSCEHLYLWSASGGGHLFTQSGNFNHGLFFDLTLQQDNDAKAYWYQTAGDFIDNLWMQIDAQHALTATVAGWYLHTGSVNRNKWQSIRPTYSGNFVWDIETTSAASYANDNTFEGVTSEINQGGLIKIRGGRGTRIADVGIYDLGTSAKDLIDLGTSASGLLTFNTTLQNARRHGGTLGGGLYDVTIAGSSVTPRLTLINCGGATGLQVNANSKRVVAIESSDVTFTNGSLVTHVGSNGVRPVYREVTASETVSAGDSGATIVDKKGSGQTVLTLPPTVSGVILTFVCGDAGGELAISPDAADKIMGKGITAADNKDYVNTGATNAVGDLITIVGDGVDGWWVTNERGTWAREV